MAQAFPFAFPFVWVCHCYKINWHYCWLSSESFTQSICISCNLDPATYQNMQHFLHPTHVLWNPTALSLSHHYPSLSKPRGSESSFPPEEQPHNCITMPQSIIPFHQNLTETLLKDPYVTFAHGTYLRNTNGKFEQDTLSQIFNNPLSSNPYLRGTQPGCRTHSLYKSCIEAQEMFLIL